MKFTIYNPKTRTNEDYTPKPNDVVEIKTRCPLYPSPILGYVQSNTDNQLTLADQSSIHPSSRTPKTQTFKQEDIFMITKFEQVFRS
ncbi:hypothetical protein HOD75_00505 [archaeon]|jgi:hypothetical protein|nr:hypothetical protein [archaeon]MBT4241356.1 hypothetical protein [archaeon]MBT4418177.1 hypothetical protein [archaeon]